MKYSLFIAVSFALLGCASTKTPAKPADPDLEGMLSDLTRVEEALASVENHLGHLESEFSASRTENEFTELAIDSVQWAEQKEFDWRPDGGNLTLWCHPSEWRGFGKLLRFTRLADPVLFLEAEGHPTVPAQMTEGGICNEDGSTCFALLSVPSNLEPGVEYHLRPRNDNQRYRWSIPSDLVVAAK